MHYPKDDSAITGLSGLIELGNAWESIDIYYALIYALTEENHALQNLAYMRISELLATGHKSLIGDEFPVDMIDFSIQRIKSADPDVISTNYHALRKEADQWQQRRTDYMMARLIKGYHPDTDPKFWSDWHDNGPPAMVIPESKQDRMKKNISVAENVILALAFNVIIIYLYKKWKRYNSLKSRTTH